MNIDNLIKKFDAEYEEIQNRRYKKSDKTPDYWLLLGKSESLANSIVSIIEEYAKENQLSEFQQQQLKTYKV